MREEDAGAKTAVFDLMLLFEVIFAMLFVVVKNRLQVCTSLLLCYYLGCIRVPVSVLTLTLLLMILELMSSSVWL